MTKQIKSKGFTIVELLIVIVVIAILAAITIVAYNGIQNRAHTTAQKTAAENVAKKIESYNAINSKYPDFGAAGTFTSALNGVTDSSLSGSGLKLLAAAPNSSSADGEVTVYACDDDSTAPTGTGSVTGFVIAIYDRTLSTAAVNYVQAGGRMAIVPGASGAANTLTNNGTTAAISTCAIVS